MGVTYSRQTALATQDNRSFQEVPEGNGFIFFGQVLPIEMCEEILLNVPASDLIKSVTKVCQNWHHLLTTLNFWLRKVKRDGFHLSASIEKRLTEEDLCRALRVLQGISSRAWPLNSNLIHNPSGKDRLKHWIVQHGGNGLKVECPPSGSNAIPEKAGLPTQHCFVSSYTPCVRSQTIILKSHKIEPWIMDILRPEIHVSEWVCARWDCNAKSSTIVEFHGVEEGPPSVHKINWSSSNDGAVNSEWFQMRKVITDYPAGLCEVKFTNISCDEQFWAGNYGAKTAGSSVVLHV